MLIASVLLYNVGLTFERTLRIFSGSRPKKQNLT